VEAVWHAEIVRAGRWGVKGKRGEGRARRREKGKSRQRKSDEIKEMAGLFGAIERVQKEIREFTRMDTISGRLAGSVLAGRGSVFFGGLGVSVHGLAHTVDESGNFRT
jgi:hypothetical protein